MALKIQLRRGTAAEWTSANPVLMQGEMGVETDTLKVKLGDGSTSWTSLAYFTQGVKGDTGATGATGPKGDKGDKGDIGETGPANTLTVGTVTTGAPGSAATVTITGTAPNQTISFSIPEGIQGIQGIQGEKGDTGLGVPEGGTEGQIIVRTIDGTVWQDNYARNIEQAVKNTTGSTLTKGTAVYISGATGDNALVAKAQANSEMTSSKTFGLLAADIPNDGFGAVITEGTLYGVNTSAASAGDPVWLSPSTAGGLVFGLANRPVAPNHMVYLGIVLRAHAVNGSIFVKVQNGYELDELHNVLITTPADKQVLQYESSSQLWKNKTASGGVRVSESEPEDTISGDGWFYSEDGTLFIRYNDGNSTQWVQPNAVLSSQIEQRYHSPNYVINGAFEVNQRGFTSTTTNEAYGFDRWNIQYSSGTVTYSAQSFSAGTAPEPFLKNFARVVVSNQSLASSYAILRQAIEDVRTLAGQTVTVSFWARSGSGTPTIALVPRQEFGLGGSPSSPTDGDVNGAQSIVLTGGTSWTRYSKTFVMPSISGKTIGTTDFTSAIVLRFWLSSGSAYNAFNGSLGLQNNTFDIAGVQLEEGVTASPFRRNANSIQGELAACQRYFVFYDFSGFFSSNPALVATKFSTTDALITQVQFPVEMRTAPTLTRTISTARAVTSAGIATVNATGIAITTKMATTAYSNNSLGAGYGWIDNAGVWSFSSEL